MLPNVFGFQISWPLSFPDSPPPLFCLFSLSTPLLLCIFFYLPSFLCKETLLLPPQATAAAAAAAGALKHMWSKMYLLSRACIFSLSIPASLSCSTPKGSESQLSVLSLFAMEGCRYKGMQCRLPEVSQWMDRAEKRRACVRFVCVCNLPLHLHIPIIIWLRAAIALHRKHRSIHMEDTLVTSVTLNISCCTAEPPIHTWNAHHAPFNIIN